MVMTDEPLLTPAKRNVETIASLEQHLLARRSMVERIGGGIARFFGSLWFISAHALFFASWLLVNLNVLPGVVPFDPYPFPFLGFVIGVEFIFLTTFVLMNQNLMSQRQEQWAHVNLQICLLAEQEVTKNMQMLQLICNELGLEAKDPEAKEMTQAMPIPRLVEEIYKARENGKRSVEAGQNQDSGRHR